MSAPDLTDARKRLQTRPHRTLMGICACCLESLERPAIVGAYLPDHIPVALGYRLCARCARALERKRTKHRTLETIEANLERLGGYGHAA